MYNHYYEEIPFNEIPDWDLVGTPEYLESVYTDGVREPILVAQWEDVLYLIGGNRRILSLRAARAKAEEDGTLDQRPWLNSIPAMVYIDMPPEVQAAWAIKDNEERSDNPLHLYTVIKAAMAAGNWEQVFRLSKLNKQRFNQAMEYDKLTPELLTAVIEGRLTKSNALAAARLGARQEYVLELANKRGEGSRITSGDIKAAKQARATAVLQVVSQNLVPAGQVNQVVEHAMFLIGVPELFVQLRQDGLVFTDFRKAFEESSAKGAKIFRLVEV